MTPLHRDQPRRTPRSWVGTKQISRRGTGGSRRGGSGDIDTFRVLSSAGMILATARLAGGVTDRAVVDALIVGLGADVVW